MPTQEERNEVAVELVNIKISLEDNRLVQAHGKAQKVVSMIDCVMSRESREDKIDNHEWWGTRKKAMRLVKQILDGNPDDNPCEECGGHSKIKGIELVSDLGASL